MCNSVVGRGGHINFRLRANLITIEGAISSAICLSGCCIAFVDPKILSASGANFSATNEFSSLVIVEMSALSSIAEELLSSPLS